MRSDISTKALLPLPRCQRWCYSVGHVHNDLTASVWFSFLLVYLHSVVQLDTVVSGLVVLIGHVVDACCTPVVGILSDRSESRYGRRKSWHAIGSAAALLSFPFILSDPCTTFADFFSKNVERSCPHWTPSVYLAWYGCTVAVFQFGWASVQTTHLALARGLTESPDERLSLYSNRFMFGILSNMAVFVSSWALLSWWRPGEVGPDDATPFFLLTLVVTALGGLAVIVFHGGVQEHQSDDSRRRRWSEVDTSEHVARSASKREDSPPAAEQGNISFWLSQPEVWLMSLVYTSTRLVVNISQM